MTEEPNYGELTVTSSGRIRASYMVPGYVGQTTAGEPTYIFREACTNTFPQDVAGEFDAWQWLHGVAAGHDRMLGERTVRHSTIRGVVVTAQAVTVAEVSA